jgi:hypothetical protein
MNFLKKHLSIIKFDHPIFILFQIDEAVQFVHNESVKGVLPSEEVLILLAQHLYKMKDVKNLAHLRTSLPVQTSIADKIYECELSLRLLTIHQVKYYD